MIRIKGHAVHSMFVHFPSALFPVEFVGHGIFLLYPDPRLAAFCFYALLAGTLLGWLAALIGLVDLLQLSEQKENQSNLKLGMTHGGIQATILCAYTILTFVQFEHSNSDWLLGWPTLVIKLPLVFAMIVANFFGAELLLKILKREWMKTN